MKLRLFTIGLTSLALALSTSTTFNQPSLAQGANIVCGTSKDPRTGDIVPTTIARNASGKNVVVMRFVSKAFGDRYTPQQRCQIISERFQKFASDGTLKYIKSGKVNGQPALCAVPSRDEDCKSDRLLLTLVPGSDAGKVARDLMDHAKLSTAAVSIFQDSGSPIIPVIVEAKDGSVTVDVVGFLDSAPEVEGNNQPLSQPLSEPNTQPLNSAPVVQPNIQPPSQSNRVSPKPSPNSNGTELW